MHILTREVKAFKSLDPLAASLPSEERAQARNVLGEAFGSKKAKQAIRAAERNQVDVSAMEGVAGHLQDTIDTGTGSLPSQGTSYPPVFGATSWLIGEAVQRLQRLLRMKVGLYPGATCMRNRQMRYVNAITY
jgi:hypothetical protein